MTSSTKNNCCVIDKGVSKSTPPLRLKTLKHKQRIQYALGAYLQANKTGNGIKSQHKTAIRCTLDRATLGRRIRGGRGFAEAIKRRQRLSVKEECELKDLSQQLEEWGWPARINQLEKMTTELLELKGDTKKLRRNWTAKWLKRHPEIKSKFVPPLDKSRAMAQNAGSVGRYSRTWLYRNEKSGLFIPI